LVPSATKSILALQPEKGVPAKPMIAKVSSLMFAVAALAGAVIFAQQKGREKPRPNPVFDTSKSGTPTPIDASDEEKENIRKQNEHLNKKGKEQAPAADQRPARAAPGKKKHKPVMPSSKSYIPDSPE